MRKLFPVFLSLLLLVGCSKHQQQPSDADQKRIEQEHEKAVEQQKHLTSGEGNSMLRDQPASSQGAAQQEKQNQKQAGAKANQKSMPQQQNFTTAVGGSQ